MTFKQFTKTQVLISIGREQLQQLFARFSPDLLARNLALPDPSLTDDLYYLALAHLLLAPEGLPEELVETLFVVEAMATPRGHDRLAAGFAAAGIPLVGAEDATAAELAVQAWLARPDLVVTLHNRARLGGLARFDYFGCSRPKDLSRHFAMPTQSVLDDICRDLDFWFREHNRGRGSTRVEVCSLDGECVFLIRHGDTYTRTVKISDGRLTPLHFRPAKDDIVVYTPHRDEIRIHAETKGEKELYRRTFGQHLRGASNHFCQSMTYTLEPLRKEGLDALYAGDATGITGVGLREVEMRYRDGCRDTVVRKSKDVFTSALLRGAKAIPDEGEIVCAAFDVRFEGAATPSRVVLRPPNTLRLGRNCDSGRVDRWMCDRGFRIPTPVLENREEAE